MKFFDKAGKVALGSRLRFMAEKISSEAADIYSAYDTNLNPKWFPIFYTLTNSETNTVTSIAEEIGHSHVSVIKMIREMADAGLVSETRDTADRRRTYISLTKSGVATMKKMRTQYEDVREAIEGLTVEAEHDLWAALGEWERLLEEKSLLARVLEKRKGREAADVVIEPYKPKYKAAFRELNEQWITQYFEMEKPDYESLENPKRVILDPGGFIFVAVFGGEPVGVCALMQKKKGVFELAKMAVASEARGRKIGWLLGRAAIEKARSLKAKRLYLESNTVLKPAISLYRKLGFREVEVEKSPYKRANIQMEFPL